MAALDGLGFANYAIGMGEKGRDFVFQQAERVRAQIERERMQAEAAAARERNAKTFGMMGGAQPPQMGLGQSPQPMPQQPPQVPQMAQGSPRGGLDGMISEAEKRYGLPSGYLRRTAQIESRMDPNARNPRSSAKGLFQFIDGTAKQYGLTNPMDPAASTDAAARYTKDSARMLKAQLGRDPSPGELYLAHQQGAQTAVRLLRNPNAPVTQVLGRQAILLNGGTPNMTAGQFAQKWLGKFGDTGQPQGVQMASAGPVQLPQMQQQAQAPQMAPQAPQGQMPGANIPTEQLIAIFRDPGSSDEDRNLAKMLLEPRMKAEAQQDPQNPFSGTSMDAQIANILIAGANNPAIRNTPQYQMAVAIYTQPKVNVGPDGRVVTINPTLPAFAGGAAPQIPPQPAQQPAPTPEPNPPGQTTVPGANVTMTGDPTPQPIPGDQAARLAMAQAFLQQAPDIIKEIERGGMSGLGDVQNPFSPQQLLTGAQGSIDTALGRGARGEIMRRLSSGQEALVRALTGAAMTEDEARMYARRYAPAWDDTRETMLSKARQLVYELERAVTTTTGGRRLAPEVRTPSPMPPSQYGNEPLVTTKEQFDALPSGTLYREDDGKMYRKP